MAIPTAKALLLEGKKGLIVGIANDRSIAWGCARAFRALGAELAITYVNEKTKKYVDPLATEAGASIFMPMHAQTPGQMEAVFERIARQWGTLDFVVHSIASAPKETLRGRVIDASRDGFRSTMDAS
jgi:enoyl-[acyl-carrier protein] reductase I